jgi:hypothetical protein
MEQENIENKLIKKQEKKHHNQQQTNEFHLRNRAMGAEKSQDASSFTFVSLSEKKGGEVERNYAEIQFYNSDSGATSIE